jgi:hypothetical protein
MYETVLTLGIATIFFGAMRQIAGDARITRAYVKETLLGAALMTATATAAALAGFAALAWLGGEGAQDQAFLFGAALFFLAEWECQRFLPRIDRTAWRPTVLFRSVEIVLAAAAAALFAWGVAGGG